MELQVIGAKKGLSVSDAIFDREFSEGLVHQVVVAYRNGGRAGTKAQKSRSDMSGTTKKFKKQKGGGARHGDYRAPIFVGGGVTFAARPRSFEQKVNKKMYRGALQSMLSELVRQDRLVVTQDFTVDAPKTKQVAEKLSKLKLDHVLIVVEAIDEKLFLAARNLKHVEVLPVSALNPLSLASYDKVLVTSAAVKLIEERLQ